MINLILLTILAVLTSVVNSYIDNYYIKKFNGKKFSLNHVTRDIVRVVIFILCNLVLVEEPISIHGATAICVGIAYQLSVLWIVFDWWLNYLRGLPSLYVGKTNWLDRTVSRRSGFVRMVIKIVLVVIFGVCIINI